MMRLRNESLPTGYLLTSSRQLKTPSLLFLIGGASDIKALQSVLDLTRGIDTLTGIDVADQRRLDSLELDVDPSRIVRVEARELAGVSPEDLKLILLPALDVLLSGTTEIFPSAAGAVGAVAVGIQFLDRESDLASLLEVLRAGRDVMIRAPRRSGKTSILRAIECALGDGLDVHFLDVERDRSLAGTAARFWSAEFAQSFRAGSRRVGEIGWEAAFREALGRRGSDPTRRFLLIDELVLLFDASDPNERTRIAQEALAGLQRLRDETGVQFAFAGSLDILEYLSDQLGIHDLPPIFRDALTYPLPPLAEDCLQRQLRRLLIGSGLVPENGDLVWLASSFDIAVPYPAQLFLDRLTHEVRLRGSLGPGEIDQLLARFLQTTDAFREFESHLDQTLPARKLRVTNALDAITRTPFGRGAPLGEIRAGLPDDDFTWMIETFPLLQGEAMVRCASRLWRRWWRTQAGLES